MAVTCQAAGPWPQKADTRFVQGEGVKRMPQQAMQGQKRCWENGAAASVLAKADALAGPESLGTALHRREGQSWLAREFLQQLAVTPSLRAQPLSPPHPHEWMSAVDAAAAFSEDADVLEGGAAACDDDGACDDAAASGVSGAGAQEHAP